MDKILQGLNLKIPPKIYVGVNLVINLENFHGFEPQIKSQNICLGLNLKVNLINLLRFKPQKLLRFKTPNKNHKSSYC